MTVTESERQRIIEEHKAEEREKLRLRMAKIGSVKSAKKRKSSIKNLFKFARKRRAQEKRRKPKKFSHKMKEMSIP